MAVRSLALQVAEAALASSSAAGRLASTSSSAAGRLATSSSPGAASAMPFYMALYKCSALASSSTAGRLASTSSSAARRTALCAVACDPTEPEVAKSGSPPFTAAVVYRVASVSSAPSPNSYIAILSTQGPVSAAWEAALENSGSRSPFTANEVYRSAATAPTMATAPSPPSGPWSTYLAVLSAQGPTSAAMACVSFQALPSANTCIAGAFYSTQPLQCPVRSSVRSLDMHVREAPAEMGVDEIIKIMNEKQYNSEDELRFKIAFHKKFFPYWDSALAAEHMQYQKYTEEEWLKLLRLVYVKAGANADALLIQVKEDLDSSAYSDTDSPAIRRIEVKLDAVLRRMDSLPKDIKLLMDMCDPAKEKMEWGTIKLFGRKFDVSKPISFLANMFL